MPLAEIPSTVQEEASRPQFPPTGSNTSPQEAMQCDHGFLDKRRPQRYAFRVKLSPHQLKTVGECTVACRGWVRCRARTRPSGQRLFCSRQGLGPRPGVHSSIRTTAGGFLSWPGRAGRPPGCILVRRTVPLAVMLFWFSYFCCCFFFFSRLPCVRLSLFQPCLPWALALCRAPPPSSLFFSLSSAPPCRSFRYFWPWLPWALALCFCPPPPPASIYFFAPFVSAFPLLLAFGAFRLFVAAGPRLLFFFVSCGVLLCRAVVCGVSSCVVLSCIVVYCAGFFGVLWRLGTLCRLVVWSTASCWLCRVVFLCPPPPAAAFVVGPVATVWSGFALCPGMGCRVVLLRRLSCGVLLSASFPAVWCSLVSFALVGAVCCCLLFLGVR